jgi:hypothetical protein
MDFGAIDVETCHQSGRNSLGSGCGSLPLSALSTMAGAVHGEVDHLVGCCRLRRCRSFDYFVVIISDARREVADGGVSDFHITL